MRYACFLSAPIGKIGIAEEMDAITNLFFPETINACSFTVKETPLLANACSQLQEYFHGIRKEFTLPLNPFGTQFEQAVWKSLSAIPYGETRSYKAIAEYIGNPKACRAVGNANNKNPIPIIIPCHRVIGANGQLGGYAGGASLKEFLITLEQQHL